MYIELRTSDTLHKKTARRLLPGSRTTVIGAWQSEGPDAWCDSWSGPAKEKTRDGPEGGEGSFPDLGDTVREAGASPHRSKGQQKYRSSPVAVHEKAGVPESPVPNPSGSGAAPRPDLSPNYLGISKTVTLKWSLWSIVVCG
jgi:hypothetical protein